MAKIGLRTSIFAPITSEPVNDMPVYSTAVHGHERLTTMSLSWQKNDAKLYADDVVAEADNSVTGAELEMGMDDLSEEFEISALGVNKDSSGEYLEDTDDLGTPGGYGYIQVSVYKGVRKYIANWFYKVLFGKSDEESTTKGESIEYSTPTITGTVMGVNVDATGKAKFRRRKEFSTYSEALAFLNQLAGITAVNLDLASLVISTLTLEPTFDSGVTLYSTTTSNATDIITAVADDAINASVAIVNGVTPVTSGDAANWEEGVNTVNVIVENEGLTKVYTVVVTKEA